MSVGLVLIHKLPLSSKISSQSRHVVILYFSRRISQ